MMVGRLRPDARHTYAWKRGSVLAAFLNAVLLVAMGSLAWEALQRLQAPAPVQGMTIMIVAAIGIVVNGLTAWLFMRGHDEDINIRGAFLHMAADALVSAGVVVAGRPLRQQPLPCRTMELDGNTHEEIPEHLIVRTGMVAASRMIGPEATAKASSCCSTECGCR